MNTIIFPLTPGADRAAVADLQDALVECLNRGVLLASDPAARDKAVAGLQRERAAGKFADLTQRMLRQFQELNHLQGNGEVDESTAKALNTLLRGWGLLDGKPSDTTARIVAGVVKPAADGAKAALAGLVVRAFHEIGDAGNLLIWRGLVRSVGIEPDRQRTRALRCSRASSRTCWPEGWVSACVPGPKPDSQDDPPTGFVRQGRPKSGYAKTLLTD